MSARSWALCVSVLFGCRAEIPSGIIACEESNDCPTGFACVADGDDAKFCVTRQLAIEEDDFDYGRVDQTNACGLVSAEPCVDACFQSDCCELGAACAEDAACTALYNCMSECGAENDECTEVCISSYPDGFDPVIDIYTCVIDCDCASSAEPPPDETQCGGFSSTKACTEACIHGSCCSLGEACENDPECDTLFACFQQCGDDTTCGSGCLSAHPDGQAELSAFLTCTDECCPDESPTPP